MHRRVERASARARVVCMSVCKLGSADNRQRAPTKSQVRIKQIMEEKNKTIAFRTSDGKREKKQNKTARAYVYSIMFLFVVHMHAVHTQRWYGTMYLLVFRSLRAIPVHVHCATAVSMGE